MPVQILILMFLVVGVILSIIFRKNTKFLFWSGLVIILVVSMFRYGMGTDFFAYSWHFYQTPSDFQWLLEYNSHMDSGFQFLMFLFRNLDLNFEWFIGFLSAVTYIVVGYTIFKYSKFRILSLFILFTSGYFEVYFNSGLRQGLVMVIFLFAFYHYFLNGKTKKYIILILFASLFHKVAFIGLIIPFIKYMYQKFFYNKFVNIGMLVGSFLFVIFGGFNLVIPILNAIGINLAYGTGGINLFAILLRVGILAILFTCYYYSTRNCSESEKFTLYVYFISTVLFISIANNQMLSRLTDLLMIVEIILLPNLLSYSIGRKFETRLITFGIILIYSLLLFKDMGASLEQGQYYNKNILNYPYVSVFDEGYKWKIYNLRYVIDAYK